MQIRFLLMNAYSLGGTIRATYNTAAALAERHDVEVVSVYRRRPDARFTPPDGVRVWALSDQVPADGDVIANPYGRCTGITEVARRVPSVLVPRSERRYRNFSLLTDVLISGYLRGLRDGVVVGTRPGLNLAVARLVRPSVVRVGQEHMFLAQHSQPLQKRIARAYPRLDLVSALTERDAADYRRLLGARTDVVRMPNAVTPVDGGVRGDTKVVVAAGRLTGQKGFDRLIPAFGRVVLHHPEWQLRIFGSGPDKSSLQELVLAHGLENSVTLMGYTDHLDEELAGAAVYVMSSRSEGFPMVLLEAMAVGLPVVSFDCRNGPADLITDGVDGLLVPDGDVTALADALSSLIASPSRRRSMGGAARRTSRRYDLRAVCARWEGLLEEQVARKDRGRWAAS